MGTTLTGTKVKDTYKSLVKLTDNAEASATGKQLSDGNGNDLGVFVDTDGVVGIGAAALVSLDVSAKTDAIRLPNGTTAQRTGESGQPAVAAGQIRYNTTNNQIEGYVAGSTNAFVDLGQSAGGGGDLTAIVAGDGLTGTDLSGPIPTLNANVDDSTIEINSDALRLKDAGTTLAKIQNVAANSLLVRDANSSGVLTEKALTDTQILIGDGTGMTATALGGDVTMANDGAVTIANDAVEFAMLEDRYTAKVPVTTYTGAVSIDWSAGTTFKMGSSLTGGIEFDFTNFKQGQVITFYNLTGSQTITFDSDAGTSETFNKVGGVDYDGSTTNMIQVECIDDSTNAIFNYQVATYASDTTPS